MWIKTGCAALFAAIIFSSSLAAQDSVIAVRESIGSAPDWISSFDLKLDHVTPRIEVRISLLLTDYVNRVAFDERKSEWSKKIENVWSERLCIIVDRHSVPIKVNAVFTHREPHHRVVVTSGGRKIDQNHWNDTLKGYVVAHEFGHMIGAFDEYRNGTLSHDLAIIDVNSIMGSDPENGDVHPRHFHLVEKYLSDVYGKKQRVSKCVETF